MSGILLFAFLLLLGLAVFTGVLYFILTGFLSVSEKTKQGENNEFSDKNFSRNFYLFDSDDEFFYWYYILNRDD